MSTFDIQQDAPGLLRTEASNITIRFDKTGPTTARISWNIPHPAAGCGAESRAYCGMVITIDTSATNASKFPVNTNVYQDDATADVNLHAGDKLGTALVVGALYRDVVTTFIDITGIKDGVPYYVTGFPVDCELRYYVEGVHAYSMDTVVGGSGDTHGTQVVVLNPDQPTMGVDPTDPTGLDINTTYDFTIQIGITPTPQSKHDSVDCKPAAPKYVIPVNGALAVTYQDLINEINHQLMILNGVQQSPTIPNVGTYYWNATSNKLYVWNGSLNVEVPNVIVQTTDPTNVVTGTYWYNPTTDTLQIFNVTWLPVTVIKNSFDPANPAPDTIWFNGTSAYRWNGVTWCIVGSLITQTTDPTFPIMPASGAFWYDSNKEILYRWNVLTSMWVEATTIQYHEDPNVLSNGTYWFDESTNGLYELVTATWVLRPNVSVTNTEPTTPAPGKFWYAPTTQVLKQRNVGNTAWVILDVLVFPQDPTIRSFCDTWWNTNTSVLSVWDELNSTWVTTTLFNQPTDPTSPLEFTIGDLWYNPTTGTMYEWNGYCFKTIEYIDWTTDPTTTITTGVVWFNTTTNVWKVRLIGNTWGLISPVVTISDPTTLPPNTMWFNLSINALNSWNGIAWVNVSYSTSPIVPIKNSLWYDTTNNILKIWNGTNWVVTSPVANVELDCHGNLLFTDNTLGSMSYIGLTDGTLFAGITANKFALHHPKPGTDGVSSIPTYVELGIGTDGDNNHRRLLQNEIRYELGYPVIDVELTQEQMDYIVDKTLGELRSRTGVAYKRGFFFLQINSETQKYLLTNKISGMNKIVDVQGVYRTTSSFLASAHGAGVYSQVVLQHLYNMGTFDLLSYHLMADYTNLMEILFAGRISFTWNEQKRELFMHHRFPRSERMCCIEATVERTEQEILSGRYTKAWILRYALATARLILAETRGKFSTLPGAGGSVSLNASDLRQAAQTEIEKCLQDIDDYVVDSPDEYGVGAFFTKG